jgi:hypothetical protein
VAGHLHAPQSSNAATHARGYEVAGALRSRPTLLLMDSGPLATWAGAVVSTVMAAIAFTQACYTKSKDRQSQAAKISAWWDQTSAHRTDRCL